MLYGEELSVQRVNETFQGENCEKTTFIIST